MEETPSAVPPRLMKAPRRATLFPQRGRRLGNQLSPRHLGGEGLGSEGSRITQLSNIERNPTLEWVNRGRRNAETEVAYTVGAMPRLAAEESTDRNVSTHQIVSSFDRPEKMTSPPLELWRLSCGGTNSQNGVIVRRNMRHFFGTTF